MRQMFFNSTGALFSAPQVVEHIREYIAQQQDATYKVIIGTDSRIIGNNVADFVTAIVVHRVGNGGRYFWRRERAQRGYNLRDRIVKEVLFSLELSGEIVRLLSKQKVSGVAVEIHIDVGDNGPTSALIAEVAGMVRAHNLVFRTKPESYAASSVADKHV